MNRKRTILRELTLATAAGAIVTVSPFTPNELAPSLFGGAAVGGGVLAWRLRRASPVWQEVGVGRVGALDHAALVGLLTCLLTLSVFFPTLRWMYGEWTRSIWVNDHGLFVAPFMAWLAWKALRDDAGSAESSAWGFLPLTAGLALAALDANVLTRYLAATGLLLVLPGLSLLLLGTRRTRALRLPLLMSLLLIPVPYTLATPLALRSITASGVLPLLHALGLPAVREGTLILMSGDNFLIADACSGIAALYASVACSLMLAASTRAHWRKVLIILLAPPLAVVINIARVTALILLCQWFGSWLLDTPIHEATGVATFFAVTVILFLISYEPRRGREPAR